MQSRSGAAGQNDTLQATPGFSDWHQACRVHVTVALCPTLGFDPDSTYHDCTIIASVHAPHTESSPTHVMLPNLLR